MSPAAVITINEPCSPDWVIVKYCHISSVLAMQPKRNYEDKFSKHTKLQYLIELVIRHVYSRLLNLLLETKTSTRMHNSSNMFWRLVLQRMPTLSIAMHDPLCMIITLALLYLQCDNYYYRLETLLKVVKHCRKFILQFFKISSSCINLPQVRELGITLLKTFYIYHLHLAKF